VDNKNWFYYNRTDSMKKLVKENHFLLNTSNNSTVWNGMDEQTRFTANLKKKDSNWKYRTAPVQYTLNSQGYRTDEFEDINWQESVVIFGCSMAFGIGVTDCETVSSILSKIIDRPVINMAISASSIDYNLHNAIVLRSGYPKPKAVVDVWTGYDRTIMYKETQLMYLGPWSTQDFHDKTGPYVGIDYMQEWMQDTTHAQAQSLFNTKLSRQLWKNTTHIEGSYFTHTSNLLGCFKITFYDQARDLYHPGLETNQALAEYLAEELKGI
jgi:hypothetical protein